MTVSQLVTVDQAIDAMRALGDRLAPGDGVGVFNRMYLSVTELVRQRLPTGCFADPAAMAELDGVFAARYLAAVDTATRGGLPPACWRPLFELRERPGIHALQFALAGMNAHIEHDLPLSVVDTCESRGAEPARMAADYRRVDGLLAELERQIRAELLPEPAVLRATDAVQHAIGVWSIDGARDAAWASVLALWELRRVTSAYRAFADALSASVELVNRALLTPLG